MKKHDYITGIQQAGIGVVDAEKAKQEYKKLFGMEVLVFDDHAPASLMTRYTGDVVYNRRAIMTLNLQGGGGLEIWQYTDRVPKSLPEPPRPGDLGINAILLKTRLEKSERVMDHGFNLFLLEPSDDWFYKDHYPVGGVFGALIGVSNLERSIDFYRCLLGDVEVKTNKKNNDKPAKDEMNENSFQFKVAVIKKKASANGAFSRLLGDVELQLIEVTSEIPKKIYQDRQWGDPGFIHLCFDVNDMNGLKAHMESNGYIFTVDSMNAFEMESASGRFCYVEDPDGTLIELVETHKVPVIKKWNWYFNLKKYKKKPLPRWMIKMMGWSRVK
jgi:catechol 2,3-dioxygenase-like lactoylglutathione lyase family enzyme